MQNNFLYFSEDNFNLFKGDSFEVLKTLKSKSVDFVFADPPYFLSSNGVTCHSGKQVSVNKGTWDTTKSIEDKLDFHRRWISLCKTLLKDDGTIMISSTLHSVYAIGVALEMEGFSIINNVIWRKTNPAPNLACRCFTHSTETIIWARKVLRNNKKGNHYFDYETMKSENNGKQMKDFWEFQDVEVFESSTTKASEKKQGKHPTQKPIALLERLIKCATRENDLILDPFNGSGTTGIVAKKLNRKYIGIELNEEYLELTKRRFKEL